MGLCNLGEITVEQSPHLRMAEFVWAPDAGAPVDGVRNSAALKPSRGALRGRDDLCERGQSATIVYS